MTRSSVLTSCLFAVALAAPLSAQTAAPTAAAPITIVPLSVADSTKLTQLGHTYTRWLLNGRADSLIGVSRPEFLAAVGGADGLSERVTQVGEHAGAEVRMVVEKITRRNGKPQFWHEGEFALFADEALVFRFILDTDGKISGLGIGPRSQSPSDN